MQQELIFALISTGFILWWAIPLWRDILRGRTIPHPFTMWVWFILAAINIYSLFLNKEYIAMIAPICLSLLLFWEMLAGIRGFSHIRINWFDYLCQTLSGLCVLYLIVSRDIFHTILFTIVVDFIALLPTVKKGWIQPWTETTFNFFIAAMAQFFIILSLWAPDRDTALFWWYVGIIDTILVVMILSRRYYLKWWNSIFE